jgi:hypothetical protein
MAYDEGLVQRIRELVQHKPNIIEKKMFGGIAFMAYDYMSFAFVQSLPVKPKNISKRLFALH